MPDLMDVYTDGARLTASPAGITLTLTRSIPADEGVPEAHESVVRLRMSHEFGGRLASLIETAVAIPVPPDSVRMERLSAEGTVIESESSAEKEPASSSKPDAQ